MRNWKNGWFSFQGKVLLTYIFIISISFTIAFVIFAASASREAQVSHVNYMVQLNRQINNNINVFLSEVDRISYLHVIDLDLQNILAKKQKQNDVEYVKDLRVMKNAIAHSIKLNPIILSVSFIGRNGNIYSNTGTDYKYISQMEKWVAAAKAAEGKRYITPVYDGFISFNRMTLLSLTRVLFDTRDMKEIGYVSVDIDFKRIRTVFEKEMERSQANNLLIIQNNQIIYNSLPGGFGLQESETERIVQALQKNSDAAQQKTFDMEIKGKKYLFVASENESTGWKVIQFVSMDTIHKSVSSSIKFYFTTILILLLSALFVGYILSWRMVRPINRLHMAMKQVEQGNLIPVHGEDNRKDDIGMLIKSFNHMIARLKESINKEYVLKMNQKKVELKMLQAQVNPHFLYNTLSLISSIAEIEGVPHISRITQCLSEMFRYNIKQKNIVTVREELEQVDNYISIQKMRFLNKFSMETTIDESLYGCCILKFLLQPLVENAVYHGIEKLDGQGRIKVSVESCGEDLFLTVYDNGIGMSKEQVDGLNKDLEGQSEHFVIGETQTSLGIRNVHYRIRDYYGDKYGLKVYSTVNEGTYVQITVPRIYSGNCEEEVNP